MGNRLVAHGFDARAVRNEARRQGFEVSLMHRPSGAANCLFERTHGELLGLDIEAREPKVFATATGGRRRQTIDIAFVKREPTQAAAAVNSFQKTPPKNPSSKFKT